MCTYCINKLDRVTNRRVEPEEQWVCRATGANGGGSPQGPMEAAPVEPMEAAPVAGLSVCTGGPGWGIPTACVGIDAVAGVGHVACGDGDGVLAR